jgi:hypothetical protein
MAIAPFKGREVPSDMSNSSHTQLGAAGRKRLLRGGGAGGRDGALWSALLLTIGLMVCASTAMAAEIVEVRVGRHAEFTRIVFELDRAAGYRIERASPSPGVSELVVSLDATSIPRRIQSSKSLVEQVEIEPAGGRSIARVRLTRDGLKLKEMILASPPRIVLDVLSDKPIAQATPKAAPKPEAKPATKPTAVATKTPTKTTQTEARAETTTARTRPSDAKPTAEPVEVAEASKPAPAPPKIEREPTPDSKPRTRADSRILAAQQAEREALAAAKESDRGSDASGGSAAMDLLQARERELGAARGEPSTSVPIERAQPKAKSAAERADAKARAEARAAKDETKEKKAKARPMVAKKPESGGGWMTWALAAVGAIALLVGGLLFLRSRRGGDGDLEGPESEPDDAPVPFGENPFAGMNEDGDQMTLTARDGTSAPQAGLHGGGEPGGESASGKRETGSEPFAFSTAETGAEGDSEEEKEMEDMDVISRDAVNESLGGMPPAMGGVPEEFQQMMREMNRRVEALEGRIDELVDARDRLERQVAAQTEELRVQRAAIARTQRAVRNLARPEDEPEATEPALRDPGKPGGEN